MQPGTTITTANSSKRLYLQQDQADRQDPVVQVDQEDPTNKQQTNTQMSKIVTRETAFT